MVSFSRGKPTATNQEIADEVHCKQKCRVSRCVSMTQKKNKRCCVCIGQKAMSLTHNGNANKTLCHHHKMMFRQSEHPPTSTQSKKFNSLVVQRLIDDEYVFPAFVIAPSKIIPAAGQGVFTDPYTKIKKGDFVASYSGWVVADADTGKLLEPSRHPTTHWINIPNTGYNICGITSTQYLSGDLPPMNKQGIASLFNSGNDSHVNVKPYILETAKNMFDYAQVPLDPQKLSNRDKRKPITTTIKLPTLAFFATKDIPPNTEIMWNYNLSGMK